MSVQNKNGFTISKSDGSDFTDAASVLVNFGKYIGRAQEVQSILADDEITSLEIRRDLLDTDANGLFGSDFFGKADHSLFPDKASTQTAFQKLARLFADHGEDIVGYLRDADSYYETREGGDLDFPGEEYVYPPVALRGEFRFMLGAVSMSNKAYHPVARELKASLAFNLAAARANIRTVFCMSHAARVAVFEADQSLLLEVIATVASYYKKYASAEQKSDVTFNMVAYAANAEVKRYFTPSALAEFHTAMHVE